MEKGRKIAWTVAAVSLTVLVASSLIMAWRVAQFHKEHPVTTFAFMALDSREFTYGRPIKPVKVSDDRSDAANPKVIITYGDETLSLPVAVASRWDLPGLKNYEDWLRVLRFSPRSGLTNEQFQEQLEAGKDRLAVVTRTPAPGVDPNTWGDVWKNNWVFDFYEFQPQGGWIHERLRYPTTSGARKPKEGELQENTWEFQAALLLMPQAGGIGPTRNFYGDALAAASWTLPVAAFSGLAAAMGIAFALAPRRRTK
jgi:hypothetical protein